MMETFVSVVMPTFNGTKYIKEAVRSILEQTHTNFELIIIDDGSTDNTKEIIESFNDKRIMYIHQNNMGPAAAYNAGFKRAASEFIFIMDHDDYSFPHRIEQQLEYMGQENLAICGSNFQIFNINRKYIEQILQPISCDRLKYELLFKPWALFNPTLCIKKKVFDKYGFFDERVKYGYDYKFILDVAEKERCGNIPELLYQWKLHKHSYGWVTRKQGGREFLKLSLDKIENNKFDLPIDSQFFIKGMAYYHANSFQKAAFYFSKSFVSKYLVKESAFYFFLSTFLCPVVILLRRYHLFNHPFVVKVKEVINGVF